MNIKFLLFFLVFSNSYAQSFKFCYEADTYYPFTNDSTSKEKPGILVEIIKEASKRSGLNLSIYRSSWKRCMSDLKQGKADVIAAMIWTNERAKWAVFPIIDSRLDSEKYVWKARYMIHKRKGSGLTWNGVSFNPKKAKISAPEGYVAYNKLKKLNNLPAKNFKATQALQLISKKRLDGFVLEELIGKTLVNKLNLSKTIVSLEKPMFETLWYAPLSSEFVYKNPVKAKTFFSEVKKVRIEKMEGLKKKYLK
jgi:polar amino acid transport system substrate-binding protein